MTAGTSIALPDELLRELVAELDDELTTAIALDGSYARGEANEYSDVDIICYRDDMREGEAVRHVFRYRDGLLLSIHGTAIATDRVGMYKPEQAIWWVTSLRNYRILLDKRGELAALMQEANDFRWEPLQPAADEYASGQLWELSEQALKLMGGLARHDAGTLYNATTNLIRNDSEILAVQRGIMLTTQNSRIQQIVEHIGLDCAWTRYYRLSMGIDEATIALPPLEVGRWLPCIYTWKPSRYSAPSSTPRTCRSSRQLKRRLGQCSDQYRTPPPIPNQTQLLSASQSI